MKSYVLCSTRNDRTDKHLPKPTLHNHPLAIMQSIFSSAARLRGSMLGKKPWKPRRGAKNSLG